ncbi:MAG: hypothetical protein IJE43_12140 [Alphaproteobacteria bacterium]|nr:hypothetical protein [Alphaproteobacteria bacterium]
MSDKSENYNLKQYFYNVVSEPLDKFNMFTTWSKEETEEFRALLDELKRPYDKDTETTKEKGDRLERLVEFIIKKSYFFEIYKNVHTETNEIDEVIVLSDRGKQTLESFGIARTFIPIDTDIFLGECKNYASNLGVTYVGKFYSLLSVTDVPFGIIFTQNGLTGDAEGYKDAYGLTKVLRMVEKYEHGREMYILTFTLDDYEELLSGRTFFELIKAKKIELQMASDYHNFIIDNQHESAEEIKSIIQHK